MRQQYAYPSDKSTLCLSLAFTFKLAVKSFYLTLIRVGTGRFSNCQELVLLTILKGLHVFTCNFYQNKYHIRL